MIFSTSIYKPVISPLICAQKQRNLQIFLSDPLSAARSLPTAHRLISQNITRVWEFLSLPGSFCDRRYCYVAKNSFACPVMRQKNSLTGQRQFLDPQIMTCTRHWLLSQHTSLRNSCEVVHFITLECSCRLTFSMGNFLFTSVSAVMYVCYICYVFSAINFLFVFNSIMLMAEGTLSSVA